MNHFWHTLDVRHWFDRYTCHGSFNCCQFVDGPDCNPPGRIPWHVRNRGIW